MFFPSARHNAAVARTEEFFPIRLVEDPPPSRNHPWKLSPQWYTSLVTGRSGWRVTVEPGLVNAQVPCVTMPYADAPEVARLRIRREKAQQKQPAPTGETRVDVYLDEGAAIDLVFRGVGAGATPEGTAADAQSGAIIGTFEPVPSFFKALGVREANPNLLQSGTPQEGQRYLQACDLVLYQPRVALVNNVTITAAAGGANIGVNPGFFTPADLLPRLSAREKYSLPASGLTIENIFFNRFQDSPGDTALLLTAYALSPPGADPSAGVTDAWTIYPAYYTHWNLAHATRRLEPRQEFPPLVVFTGLAGGVGDFLMNVFLEQNNQFAQEALDFYRLQNLTGKFWAV